MIPPEPEPDDTLLLKDETWLDGNGFTLPDGTILNGFMDADYNEQQLTLSSTYYPAYLYSISKDDGIVGIATFTSSSATNVVIWYNGKIYTASHSNGALSNITEVQSTTHSFTVSPTITESVKFGSNQTFDNVAWQVSS